MDETPDQMVERLNALSKERELTVVESALLERAINIVDQRKQGYGINRALARAGIKRDMTRYRKPDGRIG